MLTAGTAYALAYVGLTSLVPAPASPQARLLLADLLLAVPTLVALASTTAAARLSLGAERAFWSLLAGAAAAQTLNEALYALHVVAPGLGWPSALAYGAYHAFFALVGASLLVWPHRPLSPDRVRGATLDLLMGAAGLGFLIAVFVALPNGHRETRWMWVYTIEVAIVAAGYYALARTAEEPSFRGVYTILAAAFAASAAVQIVPHALQPLGGPSDLYHPVYVDWVLTLFGMAAAARAPRAAARMRPAQEAEPERLRLRLGAAAVPLPLLVELGLRAAGVQPHLAEERLRIALAFGALLAGLAALRAYGPWTRRTLAAQTQDAADESSQYLQFASGVAHELNNPLTVVAGWAELGLKRAAPRLPLEQLLQASRQAAGVVARLQRLSHAAGGPTTGPQDPPADSGAQTDTSGLLPGVHLGREALLGIGLALAALLAVQHAARVLGEGTWWGDATLALPAVAAGILLLRRGQGSRSARRRGFWYLLASGTFLWSAGVIAASVLRYRGIDLATGSVQAVDVLLLGFLVPVLGAMALRPHRAAGRVDLVAMADVAILAVALSFVFLRLVCLPFRGATDGALNEAALTATLTFTLALWAAALWRTVPQAGWQRVYGLIACFAVSYAVFGTLAGAYGPALPPPGRLADAAWTVPFLLLAASAVRRLRIGREPSRRGPTWAVGLGLGVYATEMAARALWPDAPRSQADLLLLGTACLSGFAYAARLWAGDAAAARTEAESRRQAEEVRRAGRLGALAALAAATVAELGQVLEEVTRLAVHAAKALPGQGRHVVAQAERAREIVRELSESFRLSPVGPRHPLHLGTLVEQTVQGALDQGLGLHVRVEGLAGLPRVWGDPAALSAAIHHMLRNAAQASPGGVLRITGGLAEDGVYVRLADDGPGVAPDIRSRIFDPFFTTRRVGEGLGLGLTLVHFVARSHGGAVFLDDAAAGGCFVLRLPAYEVRPMDAVRTTWPWAAAAAASAALATAMAVARTGPGRTALSVGMQLLSPMLAGGVLAWTASRKRGPARAFWALMAAGPLFWALARVVRVWEGGWNWPPLPGPWPMALFALGDLAWPAALLVRPDRPARAAGRFAYGAGAVLCVFAYAHLNLLVLPDTFALQDPALRLQLLTLRAVQRGSLVVWAAALAWQAWSPCWQRRYARLAGVFVLFAAGYTMAIQGRAQAGYRPGALTDLGWIVPLLCLAALAWREAVAPETAPEAAAPAPPAGTSSGSASWLLALAAIVALDTLLGPASGHPGLDAARSALTRIMVIAMALILAAREIASAEGASPWRRFSREVTSSRLLKVVAAALHELGGHVSGMTAVGRLLLAQPDAGSRVHGDAQRITDRGDAAARIIRNLLDALPTLSIGERIRLDRLLQDVVDSRRDAQGGGRPDVTLGPCPDVPEVFAHRAALHHALSALLDHAAGPHGSRLELATSMSGEQPVVSLAVTAGAAYHENEHGLDLVREILGREHAELLVRHRATGIAEYVVRFDRLPGQAAGSRAAAG
jgi:signal transduction histidine kinase